MVSNEDAVKKSTPGQWYKRTTVLAIHFFYVLVYLFKRQPEDELFALHDVTRLAERLVEEFLGGNRRDLPPDPLCEYYAVFNVHGTI